MHATPSIQLPTFRSQSMPATHLNRRRFLTLSGASIAAATGLATIMGSTAHDGHDEKSATPAASPAASPMAEANTFTVEMHDTYFTPKEFSIPADTEVTLKFVNLGLMQHDFVCTPLNFTSGRLNGGQEREVKLIAPKGAYQFYCSVPGHKILGMVGTLRVV